MIFAASEMPPESEKTRRGKPLCTVPDPGEYPVGTLFGIDFSYGKITLQILRCFGVNGPHTGAQTVACRVDFVDVFTAFDRKNGYIHIVSGVAVLPDMTCDKKAFGVCVRLNASAPVFADVRRKRRDKTFAFKVDFLGVPKQQSAAQKRR